jgi:PAS domain S-box-containing protein
MPEADLPSNEPRRLAELRSYEVLDTAFEQAFDDIVHLASHILRTPIAAISFVDEHRQFFKAIRGLDVRETGRDVSFCAHAILEPNKPLIVEDATHDARFADNALVTGALGVRFYAGTPLVTSSGVAVGTLCAIDQRPRRPDPEQIRAMESLGRQVVILLESRRQAKELAQSNFDAHQARERFEAAVSGSAHGIWDWSLQTGQIYLAPQWKKMLGYAPESLADTFETFESLVHRDDWPALKFHIDDCVNGRASELDVECRMRDASGRWRWIRSRGAVVRNASGQGLRFAGSNTDISDLKHAADRLKRIADAVPGVLYQYQVGSSGEADFVYVSAGLSQLLGVAAEEALADPEHLMSVVEHEDRERLARELASCIHDRRPFDFEYRIKRGDQIRWLRSTAQAGPIEADGSVTWTGLIVDITESKQAESELKSARLAAEQANCAKSQFLANMSHEIRTPMTAILGYADLLAQPESDPALAQECIHTIRRNGQHLAELINDILDLSKIESGAMSVESVPTQIPQLLDDIQTVLGTRAKQKALTLDLDVSRDVPAVILCDPTRLRQVLINLVGNAVKFTEHGSVRVEARFAEGGRPTLCLRVIDTGIGMSPEQTARLFKPFQQGDNTMTRRFGGTGLGLAISKRLVEMMQGSIRVSSVPGQGSTLEVELDLTGRIVDLAKAPPPQVVINTTPASLAGTRVLLAEDGEDNQRLISFILRKSGAEVEIAGDGLIALEKLDEAQRAGLNFDVVLTDMQMPRMDGYALARRLREIGFPGPVIALTAHAMTGDRERCIEAGCDDYTTKPIDRQRLLQLIGKCRVERQAA